MENPKQRKKSDGHEKKNDNPFVEVKEEAKQGSHVQTDEQKPHVNQYQISGHTKEHIEEHQHHQKQVQETHQQHQENKKTLDKNMDDFIRSLEMLQEESESPIRRQSHFIRPIPINLFSVENGEKKDYQTPNNSPVKRPLTPLGIREKDLEEEEDEDEDTG